MTAEGCVARERHLAARGDVSCQFSQTVLRCAHVHKVDRQKMSSSRMDNFNLNVLSPVSVQPCTFILFIYFRIGQDIQEKSSLSIIPEYRIVLEKMHFRLYFALILQVFSYLLLRRAHVKQLIFL